MSQQLFLLTHQCSLEPDASSDQVARFAELDDVIFWLTFWSGTWWSDFQQSKMSSLGRLTNRCNPINAVKHFFSKKHRQLSGRPSWSAPCTTWPYPCMLWKTISCFFLLQRKVFQFKWIYCITFKASLYIRIAYVFIDEDVANNSSLPIAIPVNYQFSLLWF